MKQSLKDKLQRISHGEYTPCDFIIADAKDGDMAFGTQTPAPRPGGVRGRRQDHLEDITAMTRSELVDIMLMSASTCEILSRQGQFSGSVVTPAVRMNDTTDIWSARGSRYREDLSLPFATADVDSVESFCDLGLYSMTFSNNTTADHRSLEAYKEFRLEIRDRDFTGLTSVDIPCFLKIQFNGYAAMNELARYDPERLVVGILGGSRGTTRDTFELVHQAEQAGARVALFGRKINYSEAPLELVRLMRATLEQRYTPEQAVRQYHKYLGKHGIAAQRDLNQDLAITDPVLMASQA